MVLIQFLISGLFFWQQQDNIPEIKTKDMRGQGGDIHHFLFLVTPMAFTLRPWGRVLSPIPHSRILTGGIVERELILHPSIACKSNFSLFAQAMTLP